MSKKLRNAKTGEVVNFIGICVEDGRYDNGERTKPSES